MYRVRIVHMYITCLTVQIMKEGGIPNYMYTLYTFKTVILELCFT